MRKKNESVMETKQALLNAIFDKTEVLYSTEDGRLEIHINPARVMRATQLINLETLKYWLDELISTTIEIHEPKELKGIGALIDWVDFANDSEWIITFGRAMSIVRGIDDDTSKLAKQYDRFAIMWQW